MADNQDLAMHSPLTSVLLHLLPGVAIAAVYFSLVPVMGAIGFPSIAALMVAVVVALVPTQLGYLLYQGKLTTGRLTLQGVVMHRNRLSVWQYIVGVAALFLVLGLIFTLMKPVGALLQAWVFHALPAVDAGLAEGYSKSALITTYALVGVFGVVVGPIVEECYFRGYLLPRMMFAGRWAPLLHSFLFALYHFWTPWMVLTRTIGTLPLTWVTQRRSLYLSIAVHVLVNAIDLVIGVIFISSMAA